jgi:Acyl-CoA dehydrogenase, C-terminal domain
MSASASAGGPGGYGFMNDYLAGRFYRDAKIPEIGEGTSEIRRLPIRAGTRFGHGSDEMMTALKRLMPNLQKRRCNELECCRKEDR